MLRVYIMAVFGIVVLMVGILMIVPTVIYNLWADETLPSSRRSEEEIVLTEVELP